MANSNTPTDVELSAKEVTDATKQGLKDAAAEKAKIANAMFDDLPGAPPVDRWPGSDEVLGLEGFLELGVDAFKDAIDPKKGNLSETQIAGLARLERSGKNRTPYVQAIVKRLGVKSIYEVTDAGPGYTNDVSATTAL